MSAFNQASIYPPLLASGIAQDRHGFHGILRSAASTRSGGWLGRGKEQRNRHLGDRGVAAQAAGERSLQGH